jgi:hypothetical protein
MTTTTQRPTTAQTDETERRDRTLRMLLSLAASHDLPLFERIAFSQFEFLGETHRTLSLHLDEETDVSGWADALGATRIEDMPVTGDTHEWVTTYARTEWGHGPDVDWHQIEVQARRDYRPRTDRQVDLAA